MSQELDPPNRNFWKLGNLIVAVGGVEIAAVGVNVVVTWLFGAYYLDEIEPYIEIVQLLHDLVLVLILVALLRKSNHIREDIDFPQFSQFNMYLLIFGSCVSFRLIFQWIVYFLVWDLYYFPYLYDSMLIITTILEILAMIKLVYFGGMINTPIGVKIKGGAMLIIIGASLTLIGFMLDMLGILTFILFEVSVILLAFGGILRIVGYFKAGKNIKFIMEMHTKSESTQNGG